MAPLVSLVIPAYQEETRLPETIRSLCRYLDACHPGTELIVVCDGCTDRTAEAARAAFSAPSCTLRVIELTRNEGKGHAVRVGIQGATGHYLFFTDADLSFAPDVMDQFLPRLVAGADVVIARRRAVTAYSGVGRRVLATLSRLLVGLLVLPGIPDSQAGYKAFTRQAAQDLFARLRIRRFLFDLEILVMARRSNYRIEMVDVDWRDRPGSKVRVAVDSLRALRDLTLICLRRLNGWYK